jgi:hypothetical protein
LKESFAVVFMIVALSLAVWYFFYIESVPLTPAETTVVVGFCAALVLCGKWVWGRFAKTKTGSKSG